MIEIHTSPRSVIRCYPENEQKHRDAIEKSLKGRFRLKGSPRKYPRTYGWTTTADYIKAYEAANRIFIRLIPVKWDCPNLHKPAPFLDPMFPEVIEDPSDDYPEATTLGD